MKKLLFFSLLFFGIIRTAYPQYSLPPTALFKDIRAHEAKLFQRGYGMIGGLQKGKLVFLDLGAEYHWRKISLFNPRLYSATANMEYNLRNNVLGYKVGAWMKRGRVDLTYGLNFAYYTNFNYQKFGVTPTVGFRLLGFHGLTGYNLLTGDKELTEVNNFYVALRYYFPVDNKFTWQKNKDKAKKDREKEKAKAKKAKEKEKAKKQKAKAKAKDKGKAKDKEEPRKSIFDIFKKDS
jgi:hypothetical protein